MVAGNRPIINRLKKFEFLSTPGNSIPPEMMVGHYSRKTCEIIVTTTKLAKRKPVPVPWNYFVTYFCLPATMPEGD